MTDSRIEARELLDDVLFRHGCDDPDGECPVCEPARKFLARKASPGPVIERNWAMPSPHPFTLKCVQDLLGFYGVGAGWVDPFAGDNSPAYIRNDIRKETKAENHMDALHFLGTLPMASADGILLDPPYSMRQRHECYGGVREVEITPIYRAASLILRNGGIAICLGWNSNGLGKSRGFELERVLLIAHGANHNDTIVTAERKIW